MLAFDLPPILFLRQLATDETPELVYGVFSIVGEAISDVFTGPAEHMSQHASALRTVKGSGLITVASRQPDEAFAIDVPMDPGWPAIKRDLRARKEYLLLRVPDSHYTVGGAAENISLDYLPGKLGRPHLFDIGELNGRIRDCLTQFDPGSPKTLEMLHETRQLCPRFSVAHSHDTNTVEVPLAYIWFYTWWAMYYDQLRVGDRTDPKTRQQLLRLFDGSSRQLLLAAAASA
jgi:hypothetical protein